MLDADPGGRRWPATYQRRPSHDDGASGRNKRPCQFGYCLGVSRGPAHDNLKGSPKVRVLAERRLGLRSDHPDLLQSECPHYRGKERGPAPAGFEQGETEAGKDNFQRDSWNPSAGAEIQHRGSRDGDKSREEQGVEQELVDDPADISRAN